jgi:cysteinyl-tRNA synthetase
MVFVRDLAPCFGADAIRLYLSSCHYRDDLHYDETELERAASAAHKLAEAVSLPGAGSPPEVDLDSYRERFAAHMNDDLDSLGAIGVLYELADEIRASHARGHEVASAQHLLRELGSVLGLRLNGGT